MEIILGIGIGIAVVSIIIFAKKMTSTKGLEKRMNDLANMAIRVQNNMVNNNEEILKETANKTANIKKDAVRTMAHAVKEGLTEELIYCKNCGTAIDSDSKFCKSCGKEQ